MDLMRRLVFSPGRPGGAAAAFGRAVLLALALCASSPITAWADCFPVSDPAYAQLDPLVDRNAREALTAVAARLRTLGGAGQAADSRQLAALYAVQADAYSILELDQEARATALEGLARVTGPTDPLRLELLSTAALNIYTQDGIRDAMRTVRNSPRRAASGCTVQPLPRDRSRYPGASRRRECSRHEDDDPGLS